VKVWDATTGQALLTLRGHTEAVCSAEWSPDGKRIASASLDGSVKIWDATKEPEAITLRGTPGRLVTVLEPRRPPASSSGTDQDKTVKVWDVRQRDVVRTLPSTPSRRGVAWSVTESTGVHRRRGAAGLDAATGKEIRTFQADGAFCSLAAAQMVAVSPVDSIGPQRIREFGFGVSAPV